MTTVADRLTSALAGSYRIERELGSGGMATVYLAEDLKHRRRVAIKVLRDDIAASIGAQRFLREIEIAAHLQHPNILPLLDSGNANGILYYVMPYVEGQSLRHRLMKQGELPVGEAVKIIMEIVDALTYAHEQGVVHRDIKPDNVMLSGRHALVTDFGVARALSEATGQQTMTSIGVALGTPAYMSPEQATADPHVDHRTDLYAVGAVAYELLSGRPPFTGITPQQVLASHVTEQAEPVGKHRPGLSPTLEQVVMKCLAKRPADRWQSGAELLAQLEPLATPSGGTQPTAARLPAIAQPKWRRQTVVLVAAVVVALVSLAVWGTRVVGGIGAADALPAVGDATQLTADDGLEIQAAISPDGKLVSYVAGAATQMRIYIRPVTGGRTITLSEGSAGNEFQPRWSPDGAQILYLTHEGAFIASALGGTARQVASRSDSASASSGGAVIGITAAAWSPDGRHLVIAHGGRVSVTNPDGSGARVIATSPYELHSCSWSPLASWIACVSGNWEYIVPGPTFGNIAPSAIVLIPAAGGTTVDVTDRTALHQSPAWSADGKRLYFISNRQGTPDVYGVDIAANGRTRGEPRRVTTGLGAWSIAFTKDGRRLVYATYTARANVWSVPIPSQTPVDASSAHAITSGNQVIEAMRVSRDGKWLLYDSNLHGNADIFRVPITGGSAERLTTDPADEFAPDLSPDGREVVFHSWRTRTRDIVVKPLAGGPEQQVTNTSSQESYPTWSPDGSRIAYYDQLIEGGVNRGLYLTRKATTATWSTPVHLRAGSGQPSWFPNGREMAYTVGDAIEVIPADSGPPRVIYSPAPNSPDPPAERAIPSEDGRSVYFKSHDAQGRASIWAVPVSGGRPRLLVRFNDLSRPSIRTDYAAGAGRFFFTLEDRQSDIWVAEVSEKRP